MAKDFLGSDYKFRFFNSSKARPKNDPELADVYPAKKDLNKIVPLETDASKYIEDLETALRNCDKITSEITAKTNSYEKELKELNELLSLYEGDARNKVLEISKQLKDYISQQKENDSLKHTFRLIRENVLLVIREAEEIVGTKTVKLNEETKIVRILDKVRSLAGEHVAALLEEYAETLKKGEEVVDTQMREATIILHKYESNVFRGNVLNEGVGGYFRSTFNKVVELVDVIFDVVLDVIDAGRKTNKELNLILKETDKIVNSL